MAFLSGMDISASGLTAQRLRMDVISENIANIDTTRTEDGTAYQRKYVVFESREDSFSNALSAAERRAGLTGGRDAGATRGVRVSAVGEDTETPGKVVYDPTHPDANEEGYVEMPNVDLAQEMVDMLSAYRSYEANITAFTAYKEMALKTLEIGV